MYEYLQMWMYYHIVNITAKFFETWGLCMSMHIIPLSVISIFSPFEFQFSSVVSDPLWPCGLQDTRPPCPSSTPGVYSNSCPLAVLPSNHFIDCCPLLLPPLILPSIRVFSDKSALPPGGQSIGVSASTSVFPMNI